MTDAVEIKPIETGFLVKEITWNQANKYYGCKTLEVALEMIKQLLAKPKQAIQDYSPIEAAKKSIYGGQ
jgi:hypothetical protein